MLSFLELGVRRFPPETRGLGESGGLHVDELVGENCLYYCLMVGVVWKVHEDGIGADIGILC